MTETDTEDGVYLVDVDDDGKEMTR
jgi:hypothetical protein